MTFGLRDTAKASRDDITDFESRTGFRLPKDYKEFLVNNSGGQCVSGGVFHDAESGRKISRINIVLGLRSDPDYGIETHLSDMEGRMPAQLLPIAYDSGGNYLLLNCTDARRGQVYFLGLESADPDNPPTVDSLALVANSFSDLLAQLDSKQ